MDDVLVKGHELIRGCRLSVEKHLRRFYQKQYYDIQMHFDFIRNMHCESGDHSMLFKHWMHFLELCKLGSVVKALLQCTQSSRWTWFFILIFARYRENLCNFVMYQFALCSTFEWSKLSAYDLFQTRTSLEVLYSSQLNAVNKPAL